MATELWPAGTTARRILNTLEREERGFTWLSRKTGLTRSELRHQLLVNPSALKVDTMLRVAAALEITPDVLVTEVAA